jgi:hypothetical protein
VVAGDDAAAFGLFGKTALDDELISGEDELPQPRGRIAGKRFGFHLPFM